MSFQEMLFDYSEWARKKKRGAKKEDWANVEGERHGLGLSTGMDTDMQLLTGRIGALLRERGKHTGEDPAVTEKKVQGLLPPMDGRGAMGIPQLDGKQRRDYYSSLKSLHDNLQKDADERGVMAKKRLINAEDYIPEERIFTDSNSPENEPVVYPPGHPGHPDHPSNRPSLKGHPGEDTGMMHGPELPPPPPPEYDLTMERMKGILTDEEAQQVKDEWRDKLLNPRDDSKQRMAMLMATGLGKAFVAPGAYGKYAIPSAQAALDLLREGEKGGIAELDRQEDAFHDRVKNLESGLNYDDKYARAEQTRQIPQITVDGVPVNQAEFELLSKNPELMAQLTGQAVNNDPRIVGPMAARHAAGVAAGDTKAQLQAAQAEKYLADAEVAKARQALREDMAPLEKAKLEAQIAEMEAVAREKEAAIRAIEDLMS